MNSVEQNSSFAPEFHAPLDFFADGRVITIVSTTDRAPIGKTFTLDSAGAVVKKTAANFTEYRAQAVEVQNLEVLGSLISRLGPDQFLILGCIPEAGLGEYRLNSESWFEKKLHLPKGNGRLLGPVDIGDGIPRFGRFKENFQACRFALIDRDFNPAMPEALWADDAGFAAQMECVWPGFATTGKLIVGSSSNRVLHNGQPLNASPSQHIYVEIKGDNWGDWDQLRTRLDARAINAGLGFVTFSKGGAALKRSVFDVSVISLSRPVFEGAPQVGKGLTLAPASLRYLPGPALAMPDPLEVEERTEYRALSGNTINEAGRKVSVSNTTALTLETVIETRSGVMTVADYQASTHGKLRCQTPFRDSDSWNAILNRNAEGAVFVHDNGAGVTYWLADSAAPAPEPEDPFTGPDSNPPAPRLGGKSDFEADLNRLRNGGTATARATARAILTSYVWQCPRKRTFAELAETVIAALPPGINPSLPRSLRRFMSWLENQSRAQTRAGTCFDANTLETAAVSYETKTSITPALLADIVKNPQYLWLIKAPHGSGKTESLLKPLAGFPGCCVAITNRVSLVADLSQRLKLADYKATFQRDIFTVTGLAICLPSLVNPKFRDVLARADIVLIDEISATLRETYAVGGTLKESGPDVARTLGLLFDQARIAVAVDADLSTLDVLTLQKMTRRPIRVVEIKAAPCGLTVEFDEAGAMKATAMTAIEAGEKVRIVSDSSRTVIELTALIKNRFPEKTVLGIQSRGGDSTAGDPEVLKLLQDINREVHRVDVLLHSPTVESGVSLVIPHFTRTFGFFSGLSVAPAGFIQMLRRDRTATHFEIGFAGHGRADRETRDSMILNNLDATHRRTVELASDAGGFTIRVEPATPFDERVVKYAAQAARDRNNSHQNLLLLLEDRGFTLNRRDPAPPLSADDLLEARRLADDHYQETVLNAADLTPNERKILDATYQPTPSETARMEKFDAALANGIAPVDLDSQALRYYEHGRLNGWNWRFDALTGDLKDALIGDQADADAALPHVLRRHGSAQASAFQTLFQAVGIDHTSGTGTVTAASVLDAYRQLASGEHRPVLEHASIARFDRLPKYPIRWLGDALAKFGLSLEEAGNLDSARTYRIRPAPLLTKDGLTVKAPGWLLMREIQDRRHMAHEKKTDIRAPSAGLDDLPEPPPTMWT